MKKSKAKGNVWFPDEHNFNGPGASIISPHGSVFEGVVIDGGANEMELSTNNAGGKGGGLKTKQHGGK